MNHVAFTGMMDVNDGYAEGDFQNMFYKDGDGSKCCTL